MLSSKVLLYGLFIPQSHPVEIVSSNPNFRDEETDLMRAGNMPKVPYLANGWSHSLNQVNRCLSLCVFKKLRYN